MNELSELSARITTLENTEAIKKLKAKYFRCLDNKSWDELAECFAEDATTAYTDGQYRLKGKDQIMEFLKAGLGRFTFFGFHQAHHPEIEVLTEAIAKGVWSAHYYMIDTDNDKNLHCGAFYQDEFAKIEGKWKIQHIGYTQIFQESWDRNGIQGLSLSAVKDFSSL